MSIGPVWPHLEKSRDQEVPFNHRIYPEFQLGYLLYFGDLNTDECLQSAMAVASNPAYSTSFRMIHDATYVTKFTGGFPEISNHMHQRIRMIGADGINAENIVIAADDTIFGVSRIFQQITESRGLNAPKTVRSYAEASQILGWEEKRLIELRDTLRAPLPATCQ